jgi:hypothetical protein
MFRYCVTQFRFSEDEACRRIQAARVARRFPAIFDAIAEGRLHLTAVLQLDSYLTSENAAGLLAAAAGKTRLELEEMLATRFPRTELLALVVAEPSVAPRESAASAPATPKAVSAPARINPPQRPTPIAQDRYAIQFSTGRSLHDKLRHAQELMGCTDLEQVFDRALDA